MLAKEISLCAYRREKTLEKRLKQQRQQSLIKQYYTGEESPCQTEMIITRCPICQQIYGVGEEEISFWSAVREDIREAFLRMRTWLQRKMRST